MVILALICANGLGHYRRTIGVLARLQALNPDWQFSVCCENWQRDALASWSLARDFWCGNVVHHPGIMSPGVTWDTNPAAYESNRLVAWESRLEQLSELKTADLVLSDNLPGVLRYRRDAVLMGSFLWGPVLEVHAGKSAEVRRYVNAERALLSQHRPPMICVEDLAMPSIKQLCTPIPCGFMCPEAGGKESSVPRDSIALLLGATDSMVTMQAALAQTLTDTGESRVLAADRIIACLPEQLRTQIGPFSFDAAGYRACKVVVCRPGVGTISECIAHGTPMVTVYEVGNAEMEHNARVLEGLGMAINAGSDPDASAVAAAIGVCERSFSQMQKALENRKRNGYVDAVGWLAKHLAT